MPTRKGAHLVSADSDYAIWTLTETVNTFRDKNVRQFFQSERHFLGEIGPQVTSVLDVGCASGRFQEFVTQFSSHFTYTGLDISERNIASARELFPQSTFHLGDALDIPLTGTFDLVNATGVMQHCAAFESLIERMCAWSNRHVLFDVKFSTIPAHVVDKERSYCLMDDARTYFVILAMPPFLRFLAGLPRVSGVRVFGYETGPNEWTHLPDGVDRLVSAGILLELGAGGGDAAVRIDGLPDWLR